MKAKTIKKVLAKNINKWMESIEDEELKKLVKENTIVTGGCFTSMLLNEKINDFDIYFRTREVAKLVALYYVNKFDNCSASVITHDDYNPEYDVEYDNMGVNAIAQRLDDTQVKIFIKSKGVKKEEGTEIDQDTDDIHGELSEEVVKEEKKKYRPVFLSANAITLSDRIQLVIRFTGEPNKIHETYDFIHCTNYWTSWNNELVLNAKALESILTKELIYSGSLYPVCSIMRMRKFIKRGWTINAGQVLKMVFQASRLNLTDPIVFEDQLVGVDSAYFACMIEYLKNEREKDPNFVLDGGYLAKVVDLIFQ